MNRPWHVFRKALRETRRDLLVVALTLAFGPFFVALYYLAFPTDTPLYSVAVVNHDEGAVLADGTPLRAGADVMAALSSSRDAAEHPLLRITTVGSDEEAVRLLERGDAAVAVVLGPEFSRTVASTVNSPGARAVLTMRGDPNGADYGMAAGLCITAVDSYLSELTGRTSPLQVVEQPLGATTVRSAFDRSVPGVLVFAVIMLVFQAAMAVAREAESGTLRRLRMTRMTSFDFLAGTSGVLVLTGLASVLLTFATAVGLGFRSEGPLWAAMLVAAILAMAVIGVGLMVAAMSRSVVRAFIVANFPFALLAFFSGSLFPVPDATLFRLAGHDVGLLSLLPSTHAVAALDKIFTLGRGLGDATFEVAALTVLTAAYFAVGVILLNRSQLRART